MSIERFFIAAFSTTDFITQNKAKTFLYYSFLMFALLCLLIILYLIMPLSEIQVTKGIIGGIGIMALVSASLFCLRTGNLGLAVWVYALPTILMVAVIRYINAGSIPETAFSTYVFYMPYLIVFVAVFGKKWQVPLTTAYFSLTNIAVYMRVRSVTGVIASTSTTGIINSSIGILVTGVVAYSLVNIMEKYSLSLKKEAEIAASKVEKVKNAMAFAHEGMHVGSRLMSESVSMEKAAGDIEHNISAVRQEVVSLGGDIRGTKDANNEIVKAAGILSVSSEAYQSMAVQASAAVTEMTASIDSITGVTTRNKTKIEELASNISDGLEKVDSSAKTISQITQNSESLLDIVNVISAISEQINMLAMNAAIEAAHAGDSGKGFAVVADEIRRLAEATAVNSQAITTGLEDFISDIKNADTANHDIDAAFKEISGGIGRAEGAFEEILSGMIELSVGTKDINRAVADVVSSSQGVASSIKTTDTMIKQNSEAIEAVLRKTGDALSSLDEINSSFTDILLRAGNVKELGIQSEKVIADLDELIGELNSSTPGR